jgi:hypothetical protein
LLEKTPELSNANNTESPSQTKATINVVQTKTISLLTQSKLSDSAASIKLCQKRVAVQGKRLADTEPKPKK